MKGKRDHSDGGSRRRDHQFSEMGVDLFDLPVLPRSGWRGSGSAAGIYGDRGPFILFPVIALIIDPPEKPLPDVKNRPDQIDLVDPLVRQSREGKLDKNRRQFRDLDERVVGIPEFDARQFDLLVRVLTEESVPAERHFPQGCGHIELQPLDLGDQRLETNLAFSDPQNTDAPGSAGRIGLIPEPLLRAGVQERSPRRFLRPDPDSPDGPGRRPR